MSWAVIMSLAILPNMPTRGLPGEGECSSAFGLAVGDLPPEDLIEEIYELDIAILESEVGALQGGGSLQWIEPVLIGGALGIIAGIFLRGN